MITNHAQVQDQVTYESRQLGPQIDSVHTDLGPIHIIHSSGELNLLQMEQNENGLMLLN